MDDKERTIAFLAFFFLLAMILLSAMHNIKQDEEIQRLSYRIDQCDSIINIYETYN